MSGVSDCGLLQSFWAAAAKNVQDGAFYYRCRISTVSVLARIDPGAGFYGHFGYDFLMAFVFMAVRGGPLAVEDSELRQARKGATVAVQSVPRYGCRGRPPF